MVKFLVVGDFHGKFSQKLFNKIKKENPDILLSPGDFCGNKRWGKLFFKYSYGKEDSEIPKKIEKEMEQLEKKAINDGLLVFRKLKSLNKETYSIMGNWDPGKYGYDIPAEFRRKDKKNFKIFKREYSKNFQQIDLEFKEFDKFILVGGASSTHPCKIDKKTIEKLIKNRDSKKEIKLRIKNYNFRQQKYEELFKKAKLTKKLVIFLTHNAPYNTKLDKIKQGPAKGEHYGSYQERLLINRFKPDLVVTGHMHENFGKDKIGKSLIINSGTAMENNYITFELAEKNSKIKNLSFKKV